MKKNIVLLVMIIVISSFSILSVNAMEEKVLKSESPEEIALIIFEKDLELYGTDAEEVIVAYDEILEIDHLEQHIMLLRKLRGWDKAGDVGGNDLRILKASFSNIYWQKRNGIWSLSFVPKKNYAIQGLGKEQMFNVISIMWAGDSQWNYQNMSSMKNQFMCHWDLANTWKTPWNVEPHKMDKGGAFWYPSNGCN